MGWWTDGPVLLLRGRGRQEVLLSNGVRSAGLFGSRSVRHIGVCLRFVAMEMNERGLPLNYDFCFRESDISLLQDLFPSHYLVGKTRTGHVLFEDAGDLYMLLPDGQIQRFNGRHDPLPSETAPPQPPKAVRLELPYQHAAYQVLPGGTFLTCCRVVRPPPGIVGADVQPIPVSSVFLPGVFLVDAVDSTGGRGLFAVQIGTSLEEVGLVASASLDEVSE